MASDGDGLRHGVRRGTRGRGVGTVEVAATDIERPTLATALLGQPPDGRLVAAIDLPSRSTSAARMLSLVMPADASSSRKWLLGLVVFGAMTTERIETHRCQTLPPATFRSVIQWAA